MGLPKIALDVAAETGDAATALQTVERLLEPFDEPVGLRFAVVEPILDPQAYGVLAKCSLLG